MLTAGNKMFAAFVISKNENKQKEAGCDRYFSKKVIANVLLAMN